MSYDCDGIIKIQVFHTDL